MSKFCVVLHYHNIYILAYDVVHHHDVESSYYLLSDHGHYTDFSYHVVN